MANSSRKNRIAKMSLRKNKKNNNKKNNNSFMSFFPRTLGVSSPNPPEHTHTTCDITQSHGLWSRYRKPQRAYLVMHKARPLQPPISRNVAVPGKHPHESNERFPNVFLDGLYLGLFLGPTLRLWDSTNVKMGLRGGWCFGIFLVVPLSYQALLIRGS